jgi:hypothetical protein
MIFSTGVDEKYFYNRMNHTRLLKTPTQHYRISVPNKFALLLYIYKCNCTGVEAKINYCKARKTTKLQNSPISLILYFLWDTYYIDTLNVKKMLI